MEEQNARSDRLELPGRSDPKVNILQLVFNWLSDEGNGRWVMVLDNVDDDRVFFPNVGNPQQAEDESTPLANYLPQTSSGSILITSRNKDAAFRLTGDSRNIRETKKMGEHLALHLFRKKLQAVPAQAEAGALIRALECIPLAITQAAEKSLSYSALIG
ncbi:hypothetical protein TruAng_005713 [Truncatella angustata]|nr:hypothetical protein TruAng_005713 [Truncatella angustata]